MFFNTDDITIHYKKYGYKNKTILILPGWGNTSQTFTHIINYFKEDYTIYIMDYPGFGNSPYPNKELDIYDYTNIIRDFIDNFKIINPIIIAHSFGGRLTTLLTGYYKEQINKLILIDIATIKPKKTIKQHIKEKTYKLLKKLTKLLPKLKQEKYKQKLLQIFGSSDYKNLPLNMHKTFKNIINKDLKEYLNYIEQETLIIWGKEDQDTPLKNAYLINKLIKNSSLIIYPKCKHFSYLEEPYLTNKIIDAFINEKNTNN